MTPTRARSTVTKAEIEAVRRFNRFYTTKIGVLDKGHLDSPFGLTEARVLYELAHRDDLTARDLQNDLNLDAGYVSRLLQRLRAQKLVSAKPSSHDARQRLLSLTARGRTAFAPLDSRAAVNTDEMLAKLSASERSQVVQSMQLLERLLNKHPGDAAPFQVRTHQPGDIGWVIGRHGALYTSEFGWDATFEALVAKVASAFLENFDPAYERCWIAERNGERVGSIFVVRKDNNTAQLRLLLVEPSARGLGIGERLVMEVERFARQVGYKSIKLWTQANLLGARRIYERAGYMPISSNAHTSFGANLIGEDWEKRLD